MRKNVCVSRREAGRLKRGGSQDITVSFNGDLAGKWPTVSDDQHRLDWCYADGV